MASMLTAKEQPIGKIFSNDYVFDIPDYQRPYSWGKDQARELVDDLLSYMKDWTGKLEDIAPYFLGSIVLNKDEGATQASVIDGQQRLTTLTILLSAIRAVVDNPQVKASITKCIYEQGDVVFATEARYRLSLRQRDRDFFREYIQHEDGIGKLVARQDKLPDAQQRLRDNAELLLDRLREESSETLTSLATFIVTRCYLVTVATPGLESAYRIFGVLNSRGLDLTATDILKAEIISAIAEAKRDTYTRRWEDLEEDLGRDAFGDLFGHIRMVYRKSKPQGTLLAEFRKHVGPSDPVAFMDTVLVPMAKGFREIIDADYSSHKHAEAVNTHLHWLNRIEFKDWVPPALAFLSRRRDDADAVLMFVRDLERLAYSMLIRRTGLNERIERFSSLTREIEAETELFDATSKLQLTPEEQFRTYDALAGPLYESHSARARSLILLRLDSLVSGGGASYDYDTVTVEHVLPQNPSPDSQWVEWVPDAQQRLHWVHRIGNLALLTRSKNSAAGNYEFQRKKDAYFTRKGVSPFVLTTQVIQHDRWTEEVMQARQQELLDKFEEHWRLSDRRSPGQIVMERLAEQNADGAAPEFELVDGKHEVTAHARSVGDAFIVLEGSKARPQWTAQYHSYQTLREDLLRTGKLVQGDGGRLRFSCDVAFNSPSAASAVILGRPDNGRTSWTVRGTGQTFADWYEAATEGLTHPPASTGGRREIYRRFWATFIERAKPLTELFVNRTGSSDSWLGTGLGRTGFVLNVCLTQENSRVECYIKLPDDDGTRSHRAFRMLEDQKGAIEATFGDALLWSAKPDHVGAHIYVEIERTWMGAEADWGSLQDELASVADRLAHALRDPIQQLEV